MSPGALRVDARSVGVGFGLALGLSSVATVDKYLGLGIAAVYVVVLAAGGPFVLSALELVRRRITERQALWLALVLLLVLAALLLVVYPHVNAHTPGSGSDRDDAAISRPTRSSTGAIRTP